MVMPEKEEILIIYMLVIVLASLILLFIRIRKKKDIDKKEENLFDDIKNALSFSNPEKRVYDLIEKEKKKIDLVNRDVKEVLRVMDNLLEKLPEEEIEKFAKSKEFHKYERVLTRFDVGD